MGYLRKDPSGIYKTHDRKKERGDILADALIAIGVGGFIHSKKNPRNIYELIDKFLGIGTYGQQQIPLPIVSPAEINIDGSPLTTNGISPNVPTIDYNESAKAMDHIRDIQLNNMMMGVGALEKKITAMEKTGHIPAQYSLDLIRAHARIRFARSPVGEQVALLNQMAVMDMPFEDLLRYPNFVNIYHNLLINTKRSVIGYFSKVDPTKIRTKFLFPSIDALNTLSDIDAISNIRDAREFATGVFTDIYGLLAKQYMSKTEFFYGIKETYEKKVLSSFFNQLPDSARSHLAELLSKGGIVELGDNPLIPKLGTIRIDKAGISSTSLLKEISPAELRKAIKDFEATRRGKRLMAEGLISARGSDEYLTNVEFLDFLKDYVLRGKEISSKVMPRMGIKFIGKSPFAQILHAKDYVIRPNEFKNLTLDESLKKLANQYPLTNPLTEFEVGGKALTDLVKVEPVHGVPMDAPISSRVMKAQKAIIQSVTNWARTKSGISKEIFISFKVVQNGPDIGLEFTIRSAMNRNAVINRVIYFTDKSSVFKVGTNKLMATPVATASTKNIGWIMADDRQIELNSSNIGYLLDRLTDSKTTTEDINELGNRLIDSKLLNVYSLAEGTPKGSAIPISDKVGQLLFNKSKEQTEFYNAAKNVLNLVDDLHTNSSFAVLDLETLVKGVRPSPMDTPYEAALYVYDPVFVNGKWKFKINPEKSLHIFADIGDEGYRSLKEQLMRMGKSAQDADRIINGVRLSAKGKKPQELLDEILSHLNKTPGIRRVIHKGSYEPNIFKQLKGLNEEKLKIVEKYFKNNNFNIDDILNVSRVFNPQVPYGNALYMHVTSEMEKKARQQAAKIGTASSFHGAGFDVITEAMVLESYLNRDIIPNISQLEEDIKIINIGISNPTVYKEAMNKRHRALGLIEIGGGQKKLQKLYLDPEQWGVNIYSMGGIANLNIQAHLRRAERGVHQKTDMLMTNIQANRYRRAFNKTLQEIEKENLENIFGNKNDVQKWLGKTKGIGIDPLHPADTEFFEIERRKLYEKAMKLRYGESLIPAEPQIPTTYMLSEKFALGSAFVPDKEGFLPGYFKPNPELTINLGPTKQVMMGLSDVQLNPAISDAVNIYVATYNEALSNLANDPNRYEKAVNMAQEAVRKHIDSIGEKRVALEDSIIYKLGKREELRGEAGEILRGIKLSEDRGNILLTVQTGTNRITQIVNYPTGKHQLMPVSMSYFNKTRAPIQSIVSGLWSQTTKEEIQDLIRIQFASVDTKLLIAADSATRAAEGAADPIIAEAFRTEAKTLLEQRQQFVLKFAKAIGQEVTNKDDVNTVFKIADDIKNKRLTIKDIKTFITGDENANSLEKIINDTLDFNLMSKYLPSKLQPTWTRSELEELIPKLTNNELQQLMLVYGMPIKQINGDVKREVIEKLVRRFKIWDIGKSPYGGMVPYIPMILETTYAKKIGEAADIAPAFAGPFGQTGKGLNIRYDIYARLIGIGQAYGLGNLTKTLKAILASDDSYHTFRGYVGTELGKLAGAPINKEDIKTLQNMSSIDFFSNLAIKHEEIIKEGTAEEWNQFFKQTGLIDLMGKNKLNQLDVGIPIRVRKVAILKGMGLEEGTDVWERSMENLSEIMGKDDLTTNFVAIPGIEKAHPIISKTVSNRATGAYVNTPWITRLIRIGKNINRLKDKGASNEEIMASFTKELENYEADFVGNILEPTATSPVSNLLTGKAPYYNATVRSSFDVQQGIVSIIEEGQKETSPRYKLVLDYFGFTKEQIDKIIRENGEKGLRKLISDQPQFAVNSVIIPSQMINPEGVGDIGNYSVQKYLSVMLGEMNQVKFTAFKNGKLGIKGTGFAFPIRGLPTNVITWAMPEELLGTIDKKQPFIYVDNFFARINERDLDGDLIAMIMDMAGPEMDSKMADDLIIKMVPYLTNGRVKVEKVINEGEEHFKAIPIDNPKDIEKTTLLMKEAQTKGVYAAVARRGGDAGIPEIIKNDLKNGRVTPEVRTFIRDMIERDLSGETLQKTFAGIAGNEERRIIETVMNLWKTQEIPISPEEMIGLMYSAFDIIRGSSVHKVATTQSYDEVLKDIQRLFSTKQSVESFTSKLKELGLHKINFVKGTVEKYLGTQSAQEAFGKNSVMESWVKVFKFAKAKGQKSLLGDLDIAALLKVHGNVGETSTVFNKIMEALEGKDKGLSARAIADVLGRNLREMVTDHIRILNEDKAVAANELITHAEDNLSKQALFTQIGSKEIINNVVKSVGKRNLMIGGAILGSLFLLDTFTPNKLTHSVFNVGEIPGVYHEDMGVEQHPELPRDMPISGDDNFDYTTHILNDVLDRNQKRIARNLGLITSGQGPVIPGMGEPSYKVHHVY